MVGVDACLRARDADIRSSSMERARIAFLLAFSCARIASAICQPMRCIGCSEESGS